MLGLYVYVPMYPSNVGMYVRTPASLCFEGNQQSGSFSNLEKPRDGQSSFSWSELRQRQQIVATAKVGPPEMSKMHQIALNAGLGTP